MLSICSKILAIVKHRSSMWRNSSKSSISLRITFFIFRISLSFFSRSFWKSSWSVSRTRIRWLFSLISSFWCWDSFRYFSSLFSTSSRSFPNFVTSSRISSRSREFESSDSVNSFIFSSSDSWKPKSPNNFPELIALTVVSFLQKVSFAICVVLCFWSISKHSLKP